MTRQMPYFNSTSILPPNMTRIMGFSTNAALRLKNVSYVFVDRKSVVVWK